MDQLSRFVGGLFCRIPLGISECTDRAFIGKCVIVAVLALVAFYFLMRDRRV